MGRMPQQEEQSEQTEDSVLEIVRCSQNTSFLQKQAGKMKECNCSSSNHHLAERGMTAAHSCAYNQQRPTKVERAHLKAEKDSEILQYASILDDLDVSHETESRTKSQRSMAAATSLPGAYRQAPGRELRRQEEISFALFASNTDVPTLDDRIDVESQRQQSIVVTSNHSRMELAVARQVTGTSQLFVAEPDEEHKLAEETKAKTCRLFLIMGGAFLVSVAILSCCLVLTQRRVSHQDSNQASSPINVTKTTILEHSVERAVIDLFPISTQLEIMKLNTPQASAYEWILDDPSSIGSNSERTIQRFALATIYFALGGSKWFNNTNWLSHEHHECTWYATNMVKTMNPEHPDNPLIPELVNVSSFPCDLHRQSYSYLWLLNNNLQGQVPPELYLLTSLRGISLDVNHLEGSTISSNIAKLTSMEVLSLGTSGLAGTIPTELGMLSNTKALYLPASSIHGTLPSELGLLSQMKVVLLDNNRLTGTIPKELAGLKSLRVLYLFNNWLTATIPSQLGQAASITELALDFNQLTGPIPSELGSLTKMAWLSLYGNEIRGTIPSFLGGLESLLFMYLHGNSLTGTLPSSLGQLTNLLDAFLHNNKLTGSIPSELGLWTSAHALSFANNTLTGVIPQELGLLADALLYLLDLQGNLFSGTIPEKLCHVGADPSSMCPSFRGTCMFMFDCSKDLCGCDCDCPCKDAQNSGNYTC